MERRLKVLHVANKRLPPNDYRVCYPHLSGISDVTFGLPECPEGVSEKEFVKADFREGIGLRDAGRFLQLLCYLCRCRNKYDGVHFYSTKLQLLGPLCAVLAGIPCVTTITGFGRTFNRRELRYRVLRLPYLGLMHFSLKVAKATFFQNRGDMHWLAQRFPSLASKMHWVGSGVDSRVVTAKDFHARPLQVLMVARLMIDKGILVFCDAARRLAGPEFRFVLAGPASQGQRAVRCQVEDEHQRGTIDYRGELGHAELAGLYAASHVFAFPSRGEGMPRVMLEAGHALVCPLASDIPAHRDLIGDDRGFLLTPGSEVESLVSHLVRLNNDRGTLEHNARRFQRHILEQYTLGAYAQRLDELLLRLFPRTTRAAGREASIVCARPAGNSLGACNEVGVGLPARLNSQRSAS